MKYLLGIMLVTFTIKTLSCTSVTNSNSDIAKTDQFIVYVNVSGKDDPKCGSLQECCRSVRYALEKVVRSNKTNGMVYAYPGKYPPETVKLDCTVDRLRLVTVKGLGKYVVVSLSADIVKCNVTFTNIKWTNSSKPVLLNAIISPHLIITNSLIQEEQFSLLSTGSSIEIINSTVTNSAGWLPYFPVLSVTGLDGFITRLSLQNTNFSFNQAPILSSKGVTFIMISKCSFYSNVVSTREFVLSLGGLQSVIHQSTIKNNTGGVIKAIEGTSLNITSSRFDNNSVKEKTLLYLGQDVSLRASLSWFIQTKGISNGPVMTASKDVKYAHFMSCYFSCNQVNGSVHVSPVKNYASSSIINCTNCTTDYHCPVYCGSGEYLSKGIFCHPCPIGTYHQGKDYNITSFACNKCEPGYYNDKVGSSTCIPCKPGSFAVKSGSTMCSPCKNDFMTSDSGSASCSKLTIGFTVLTICVLCLILFPLIALLLQYLQNSSKNKSNNTKKNFTRLYDTPSTT